MNTTADLHSQNEDYAKLSPDLILDAIESLGIYPSSGLLPLNSYENRVYQFIADDNRRYVVKFYRPGRWTTDQIIEEHQYALELAEQEIPLVPPLVLEGNTLHHYQGFLFTLFPCQGGRQFEVDNLDHLEWVGRFIGRIHRAGQAKTFNHRPALTSDNFGHQQRDYLKACGRVPGHLSQAYFTILDQVLEVTQQRFDEHGNYRVIRLHGDCHPGNILWTDAGPHFVDLDDSRNGPAVQDLWMMLSGDRPQQLLQLDTLLEGYEEFADFDHHELQLIEPLRALRMINYSAWLAKRWTDPAFPRNFPWFDTDKYWEEQILALKEQLSALQERPLSLTANY